MGLFSYDDAVRRESLLDLLRDVSPVTGNYLLGSLKESKATNTLHEWPTFNVARPTSTNFKAEGAVFAEEANPAPARSQNVTAIVTRTVVLSDTEKQINSAGVKDPFAFQKAVSFKKLGADIEFAIVRGAAIVSGASGTAREMAGIDGVISTNLTARNSGTSMSVTELEDILQNSWDAVGDMEYVANTVLCPMGIKRKMATFTTRVTVNQDSKDRVFNNISYFEGSSGTVKIVPHKDVQNAAGTTHVLAINENMFRIAFLRKPKWKDMGADGDRTRGQYTAEFTLESLAERASVKRTGYAQLG